MKDSSSKLMVTQQPSPLKTRIAPTPSGYLHLGNVLSFAITWAMARKQNGTVALRIDDIDNTRYREEYLIDIFETLHFLGIDYDEGPQDTADFYRHYSQLNHLKLYNSILQILVKQDAVYACPCSRTQIMGRLREGNYPFTCRNKQLPLDLPDAAWRLRVPENINISINDLLLQNYAVKLNEQLPDFVVKRKDGMPAYQITSLCDDLRLGINLIVRGEDLLPSTAAQLYLAQLTGLNAFESIQFLHHPVLYDTGGKKLSKSHNSLSISEMRSQGATAATIWRMIARELHLPAEAITDAQSFLDVFSMEGIVHANISDSYNQAELHT